MEVEEMWKAFRLVVETRRSVRVFDGTPVPEVVVQQCIDMALLAPNSSNLQPWEFYWIRNLTEKAKLIEACLSQPTAKTAAELVVIVARSATWRENQKRMLEHFDKSDAKIPDSAKHYYRKIVPFFYLQGPFGIVGKVKSLMFWWMGMFKPTPREPTSIAGMKLWAVKSASLAAENFMLAARDQGFDSCPMEGFDSFRVRALLNLPNDAVVTMVISIGKRADDGIYGPRVRFNRDNYVHII